MIRSTFKLKHSPSKQSGFSLIEMAIVMVVLGFIIGSLVTPLSTLRDTQKRQDANKQALEIQDALIGYSLSNGFLPCPATRTSNGIEARDNVSQDCLTEHGVVPAQTLGLKGNRDEDGQLLDPWSNPYQYSLNNVNNWEYAKAIAINSGMPTFQICDQADCPNANSILASNILLAIVSLGPDGNVSATSSDQMENTDNDDNFVNKELIEATGNEFNDVIVWLATPSLIVELVRAGRLN